MAGSLARSEDDALMTVEEFRLWPGDGSGRIFDLVDGRVRAQSGPSQTHSTIQRDLVKIIDAHLTERGNVCRILPVPSVVSAALCDWNERHPDAAVTCEPNDPKVHELRNPIVIVEILSPTNASDTWRNLADYISLPSAREILYLESEAIRGYFLRRLGDGSWPGAYEEIGAGGMVELASIGWRGVLDAIYARTGIDPAAAPRRGLSRYGKSSSKGAGA
jgi:Uma2 family endonuclease